MTKITTSDTLVGLRQAIQQAMGWPPTDKWMKGQWPIVSRRFEIDLDPERDVFVAIPK